MKAILALEDGTIYEGEAFGASGEQYGEVVFNTGMTGYQEVLTDPSYKGQIVVMTYPLIGNYGCNDEDFESAKPQVEGFVVREYSSYYSNWRATESLSEFLAKNGIIGIQGIDTRALTRRLRNFGVMKGVISTDDLDKESLIDKAKKSLDIVGVDMVKKVTCKKPYHWEKGGPVSLDTKRIQERQKNQPIQLELEFARKSNIVLNTGEVPYWVVAIDGGIKHNILRKLQSYGCNVTVVPATASIDEILSFEPDGIFLSNGPGDPEGMPYMVDTVKQLIGKKPIFGICLGHQILGLAFGGRTYKLKFGHRGANHPVKNYDTDRVEITTQNHGFCVDMDSLKGKPVRMTHINLNDMTCEGMEHEEFPIFSVQYHPEASPGPHDADYLFVKFIDMMKANTDVESLKLRANL
ncbi:TPA: carbamoyl-phosphate synthase small subunit [bacterium]|nr:carbamoyl-phosphate synthase small subunit [bacterium]